MKDSRSLDQSAQEVIRQMAVKAMISGKTQAEVSELFGVSMKAVSNWWRTYREFGVSGLRKKSRRPRSADKGGKLKGWQSASIVRTIINKTPDQLNFGFMLWTRDAVAELIEDRFKIRISKWTVGRLLKQWGMSPQKPVKKAYQQQPEVVQNWLDKEYPRVLWHLSPTTSCNILRSLWNPRKFLIQRQSKHSECSSPTRRIVSSI